MISQFRPIGSRQWLQYFHSNAQSLMPIPWDGELGITADEREAISASIQEFQLGESSEGKHFISCATAYARRTGDQAYVPALRAFIAEEHRHARALGRFMDLAGIPRAAHSWPDTVFRFLRRRAGLELSITVLITAEIIARTYYAALHDATASPVLRALCRQILQDEVRHVEFQAERVAILRRKRRRWSVALQQAAHRLFMAGTMLVVWHKHGRAIRAGGYCFGRYWRETWSYMRDALRRMDPRSYSFEAEDSPVAAPPGSRCLNGQFSFPSPGTPGEGRVGAPLQSASASGISYRLPPLYSSTCCIGVCPPLVEK